MATKLSADIAQNVDITSRKGDSFYLKITFTNKDGTIYDFINSAEQPYEAYFEVYNTNDALVLGFTSLSSGYAAGYVNAKIITVDGPTAVITVDSPDTHMGLRVDSYKYKLYVKDTTDNQTNTVMYGKFKVVDI
jgi:hypothetical protein